MASPRSHESVYWRSRGLTHEFLFEIARGTISEFSHINKFGRNPDCDKAATATAVPIGRDIWDGGIAGAAAWVPPTQARTHQITSTSAEDGASGLTGALTMRIFGLDSDYLEQQEDLTLNGQDNVATDNTYTMIHRMYVLTAGSAGRNLGNITAIADGNSTLTAKITADYNQTLMAIYQVPADKLGFLMSWHADLHKAGGPATFADVAIMSKTFGGVWRVRFTTSLATDGIGAASEEFSPPKLLQPKDYIKIVANPSKDAQDIGAGFCVILVENH